MPGDVAQLSVLQSQLLESAIANLAPGGVIAYVTCSPHIAETRVVVDRALRLHSELIELDAKSIMQGLARENLHLAGKQLSAQLWPHRNNTDAMFLALLQRRLDS
jgi:16S rRNA (cytosine967-C5)-methyltransferase